MGNFTRSKKIVFSSIIGFLVLVIVLSYFIWFNK